MACRGDKDCRCNNCFGQPETKSSSPAAPNFPQPYSQSYPNNHCAPGEYNADPRWLIRMMSHSEQSETESGYFNASPPYRNRYTHKVHLDLTSPTPCAYCNTPLEELSFQVSPNQTKVQCCFHCFYIFHPNAKRCEREVCFLNVPVTDEEAAIIRKHGKPLLKKQRQKFKDIRWETAEKDAGQKTLVQRCAPNPFRTPETMEASRLEGNVLWHSSFRSCHRLQGNVSTGRPNNKTAFQLHQEAEPYRTCTPEYILRRHRNGKLFEAKYLKDILENQARVVFRSQKSNKWHLIWDLYRQSMDTPRVHEMRVYSSQMFSCWANRTDYPGGPYVPGLCDKGHTLEAFRCAVQGSVESVEGNHSSQEKCSKCWSRMLWTETNAHSYAMGCDLCAFQLCHMCHGINRNVMGCLDPKDRESEAASYIRPYVKFTRSRYLPSRILAPLPTPLPTSSPSRTRSDSESSLVEFDLIKSLINKTSINTGSCSLKQFEIYHTSLWHQRITFPFPIISSIWQKFESQLQKLKHQDVGYQPFIESKTDPTPTSLPIQNYNRLESGQSLARSGNEVVVDPLQIPRPGVDVDVGETKTRPNSPINNHYNEVENTNLAMIGTFFHLWKDAVINLVAAENELVFGLSDMQIMYIYPDIYKKLRKEDALNEARRHANEYKRRRENILQISKAENVQYEMAVRTADGDFDPSDDPLSYVAAQYHPDLYNNFTSHTFNSGSSYDAVLDD